MARIFTEGFELGDGVAFANPANWTVVAATEGFSGAYKARPSTGQQYRNLPGAYSEFYFRARVAVTQAQDAINFRSGTNGLGWLCWQGDKVLYKVGTTQVGTPLITVNPNEVHLIELHLKIADSGGIVQIKIDGQLDTDYVGDTKPGTYTTVDNVNFAAAGSGPWVDDLAFNDTTGSVDNSWCGDGRVIALKPNADGDVSQLVGSDADSVNNYALVDEVPVGSSPDDYVESDTVDQYDLYNLTACGLSNVTINRLWAEGRAVESASAGLNCLLGIKTGGSEDWTSSNQPLLLTTTMVKSKEYNTKPAGGAWSTTDLDALQVGFKVK